MYDAVHPRYTLFEKAILGLFYIIELPIVAIRILADKSRRHFENRYLKDMQ